jgi:Cys-tRNA(Pro)/Cys-tRNA(Cys) deacylase
MDMAKEKEVKTNAMRILDKNKISYEVKTYECENFIDAIHIADLLGQPYERMFKTLVTIGKSRNYFVFVIPIDKELDLKAAAKSVGEKNVEMIHVKDILAVTGYIRGGCTPVGMKKQYPTVIHESARQFDTITISGGRIGSQIILNPEDLIKVTKACYADIISHA